MHFWDAIPLFCDKVKGPSHFVVSLIAFEMLSHIFCDKVRGPSHSIVSLIMGPVGPMLCSSQASGSPFWISWCELSTVALHSKKPLVITLGNYGMPINLQNSNCSLTKYFHQSVRTMPPHPHQNICKIPHPSRRILSYFDKLPAHQDTISFMGHQWQCILNTVWQNKKNKNNLYLYSNRLKQNNISLTLVCQW